MGVTVACVHWLRRGEARNEAVILREQQRPSPETESSSDPIPQTVDLFLESAIEEGRQDRRNLRLAALLAFAVHAFLLVVSVPQFLAAQNDGDQEPVYIVRAERFKLKQPPPKKQQAVQKKRAKKIPIPDPTPDDPEPILIEEEFQNLDLPELDEVSFGIPDAPPGLVSGAGSAPDAMEIGANVTPPVRVHSPQPRYTETARQARVQGIVILKGIVDADGRVTHLKILKGLPSGLAESALETVGEWQYKPALYQGKPVAVHFTFTVNFQLQ